MQKKLVLSLVIISLTGCATTERDIVRAQEQCKQIGFAVGSSQHVQCTADRLNYIERRRPSITIGPATDVSRVESSSMTCHSNGYVGYGERRTCFLGNGKIISCYNNGSTITCNWLTIPWEGELHRPLTSRVERGGGERAARPFLFSYYLVNCCFKILPRTIIFSQSWK